MPCECRYEYKMHSPRLREMGALLVISPKWMIRNPPLQIATCLREGAKDHIMQRIFLTKYTRFLSICQCRTKAAGQIPVDFKEPDASQTGRRKFNLISGCQRH